MKKIYFTPGPTQLHSEVKNYISRALEENVCSINHRSTEFMKIFEDTVTALKELMNIPESHSIFFLSSATECMDRVIQNCVESDSLHFVNGAFSERFYKTSLELNKNAERISTEYGNGFDFDKFDKSDIKNHPELICITQNETSTGVMLDSKDINKFTEKFPDALISMDIVSSAPYAAPDFKKTDCAFFSVQKGFGLPAGLGVLIVNEKCLAKAEILKSKKMTGSYHNFSSLKENALKYQTSETPNVLGIYLLGKICREMIKYGIDKIKKETEEKSELIYEYFDKHSMIKPFVKNKKFRSKTVIALETSVYQNQIKQKLNEGGIIVGSGYGKFKDDQIRIANFPVHSKNDVMRILDIIDSEFH